MNQELQNQTELRKSRFIQRLFRNLFLGISLFVVSLGMGVFGYHHIAKMNWVDSYLNAAMILSGMGPVGDLPNDEAKIFAGSYALFSGIIFLVTVAIILAPILHHFFHKLHLEDKSK